MVKSQNTKSSHERERDSMAKTIWLTGRPASGKTTTADALKSALQQRGMTALVIDGDDLRQGISSDLAFSPADRSENVRRAAHIARLVNAQDLICIVALISPIAADRAKAREIVGPDKFVEVYLQADLYQCEQRDPKGNYQMARQGVLKSFTGIGDLYEIPTDPDLVLETTVGDSVDSSVRRILESVVEVDVARGR
jgi:adenylylsulfate kinase